MKKSHFLILFFLFTTLIFYSEPSNENFVRFGCTTPTPVKPTPSTQENCELSSNPGAVSSYEKFSAQYKYQDLTQNWEFETRGAISPKIYVPQMILGQSKNIVQPSTKSPLSTNYCEYHYFLYKRDASTQTFEIPFSKSEKISSTQTACSFSLTPEMLSYITEQTLGVKLTSAKLNIPDTIIAYEGTPSNESESSPYLTSAKLTNTECDMTQTSTFQDAENLTITLCTEKSQSVLGNQFITDAYLQEFNTNDPCFDKIDEGYIQQGASFKTEDEREYHLCVKKESMQSTEQTLEDIEISETCTNGFITQNTIQLTEEKTISLCIKRKSAQPVSKSAKSISSGLIQVCPELNGKDLTGMNICRAGGTYSCEVKVTEGPTEFYGYTVQRDSCGNILVEEDNAGLPLSQENLQDRAEGFITNCAGKTTEKPNCGNGKVEEGEECDDGNLENGDGCDKNCKKESSCGTGEIDLGGHTYTLRHRYTDANWVKRESNIWILTNPCGNLKLDIKAELHGNADFLKLLAEKQEVVVKTYLPQFKMTDFLSRSIIFSGDNDAYRDFNIDIFMKLKGTDLEIKFDYSYEKYVCLEDGFWGCKKEEWNLKSGAVTKNYTMQEDKIPILLDASTKSPIIGTAQSIVVKLIEGNKKFNRAKYEEIINCCKNN